MNEPVYDPLISFAEALRAKRDAIVAGECPMGQDFIFSPMAHEMQSALEKMPTAWYRAIAKEAELKPVKDNGGVGLEVTWKIIDGPHKDRVVKKWYNVRLTNGDTTVSEKEIATFSGCMGLWNGISNTDQILNIPIQIRLTDKKDSPDYNDVKGYKTIDGNDPVKPGAGAQVMPMPGQPPMAQVAAPPPPAAPAASDSWQRSPDNAWMLNPATNAWEANVPPAPPPPAAPPAPPAAPPPPGAGAPPYQPAAAYPPPQQPGAPPAPGAPAPGVWQPGQATPAPAVWKP